MENSSPSPVSDTRTIPSRRHALALLLAAGGWLRGTRAAGQGGAPVRLAISETLVSDVNMNDARAAMMIWLKRIMADLKVVIEFNPRVFDTTEEILHRAHSGLFDCVALNVVEYRQIAGVLDPSQIIAEGGPWGPEQYLLLAKRNSGIQHLGDLRGRGLCMWKAAKMCVAGAWLTSILDEGHFGLSEQFFGSIAADSKASRVVLPVFFGQSDACLTSKRSFDTMCELNPQVAKELTVICSSPAMVVTFYVFHKNYHGVNRERFAKVCSELPSSAAGRQLATLFQFETLVAKDISCLAPALGVIEAAERAHGMRGAGSRK